MTSTLGYIETSSPPRQSTICHRPHRPAIKLLNHLLPHIDLRPNIYIYTPKSKIMGLTVHHLQISQSERVPWLCEELGIDYELVKHQRDPFLSPQSIKDLNPIGQAPVIQDGDVTLPESAAAPVINDGDLTIAESGACLEYIDNKYGGGKFTVKPDAPNYADYLFWWHWSNGTLQPLIGRYVAASKNPDPNNMMYKYVVDKYERCMKLLNDRLGKVDYLSGSEPTLPDFMIVYTLSTGRYFNSY
ncbi:hypothetical protein Golomagni_05771, partial [Golovinomyces magnicellulatus]